MLATMRKLWTSRPLVITIITLLGVAVCVLPMACRAPAVDEHAGHDHAEGEHEEPAADEHADDEHSAEEHEDEEGALIELDEHARELAGIAVATVEAGAFDEWLEAPGVLHANPDETAVVSAPMMGTVESVSVNVGDSVRRGQTLVVVRCPELAGAQADVATAASELAAARQALARRQALAAEGEFASAPFEDARSSFLEAQQELRSAEADLKRVRRIVELGGATQPALEDATSGLADAREAVRGAEADLQTAQAALATAGRSASRLTGDTADASASRPAAEARVAAAEASLQSAVDTAKRLRSLLADGLATEQEVADSQAGEAAARADLEEARLALRSSDGPLDEARLSATTAEQDVARATSALEEAQQRLEVAQARHGREQTIAREDIPSQAQLSAAESQLALAQAAFDRARLAWEREQRLKQQDARSREALADLEGAVSMASARLRAAERAVSVIGHGRRRSGGRIALTAPVSGKISSRTVSVGATADGGQELMEIVGVRSIWVEAGFYEKDLPFVREGQLMQVEVPSIGDTASDIAIHSIDPGLDEHTRKATVRGMLDNASGRLLPDMFARVRVRVGAAEGVVSVPEDAVQSDSDCEFVFIEVEVGQYRQVDVQTGSRSGGRVEIIEGLQTGDRIVVEGAFLLKSEGSEISDSCGGH